VTPIDGQGVSTWGAWWRRRRASQGQSGYLLATVLGFLLLIFLILSALVTMTGTALRFSENFRQSAEVDRAADAAMEQVLNYVRRNDTGLSCRNAFDDDSDPATPPVYDQDNTFALPEDTPDPDDEDVVPLELYELPSGRPVAVEVTCEIISDQQSIRSGVLEAFVDGSDTLAGRATFSIADQPTNPDLSRATVTEWQIGTVVQPVPPASTLEVEYLIVGGGGAGGAFTGGGGGAGGVVTSDGPVQLGSRDFQVVVGQGGAGGQYAGPSSNNPTLPQAANGQDSSFNGRVARGGGGGGSNQRQGANGGSGGGGGHDAIGGEGTPFQGSDGGAGTDQAVTFGAGGGGGAGADGPIGQSTKGGNGGGGQSSDISGTSVTYGGGGGGGAFLSTTQASGGPGGGGAGGYGPLVGSTAPTDGAANTGGGGGGQRNNVNTTGGAGGSGVVIIRYAGQPKAEGGTITTAGGFTVHTFTAPGTATFTVLPQLEYLVVGGGGAGGAFTGGGGGGGGVLTNEGSPTGIAEGSYTVVVGAGGLGGQFAGTPSSPVIPVAPNGGQSRFGSFIAQGGGGGGKNQVSGASGGSGGGGGHDAAGGAGTSSQGYSGGSGTNLAVKYGAGGGGGAASAGQAGSDEKGGNGGAGITVSLTGTPVVYGGGGGGGAFFGVVLAAGGSGSGGNGGFDFGSAIPPTNGAPNTGGGGGGQRSNANTTGGSGGSGIVVIRYTGAPRATGGTITQSGGFTYHTFDTPGTYTINFT
jgi:hypothetical protein